MCGCEGYCVCWLCVCDGGADCSGFVVSVWVLGVLIVVVL